MKTNPVIETLLGRRSVRAYEPRQISDEERDAILNVALWSPTGMNSQSTRFVAVQSEEMRRKLFALCEGDPFYSAPTIVLVFADKAACTPMQDASIAAINMQNAAASLGVDSCWINCVGELFATEKGKELKKEILPEERFAAMCSVVLGYGKEKPAPKTRNEGRIKGV